MMSSAAAVCFFFGFSPFPFRFPGRSGRFFFFSACEVHASTEGIAKEGPEEAKTRVVLLESAKKRG